MPKIFSSFSFTLLFFIFIFAGPSKAAEQKTAVYSSDLNISCDVAKKKIVELSPGDEDYLSYLVRFNSCAAYELNEIEKKDGKKSRTISVGGYDESQKKYFFEIFTVEDLEKTNDICLKAHKLGGLTDIDPTGGALWGAYGEYACGTYIKALIDEDPVLFIFPLHVPSIKAGDQAFRLIKKVVKEDLKTIDKDIKDGKLNATDVLAPTVTLPLKAACKLLGC